MLPIGSERSEEGVILAHFHFEGNVPVEIHKLRSFVRLRAIEVAVDFSITSIGTCRFQGTEQVYTSVQGRSEEQFRDLKEQGYTQHA